MFPRAAAAGHGVLYLLMIAVPLVGVPTFLWRGASLNFGLFQIPSPFEGNRDVAHQFGEIHELLAHALIAVAVGHVLIALYHQLVLRDNTIARMKPRSRNAPFTVVLHKGSIMSGASDVRRQGFGQQSEGIRRR
jgi:cytochrome b561